MNKIAQYTVFLALSCFFGALCSCTASPDSLLGTYSVQENGRLNQFIRIEKQGNGYTLSEKQGGQWLSPAIVAPVSAADFQKMVQQPPPGDFIGLGNDNCAIFKVPKGWKSGPFTCNTGFWLASMLGPIELHKQ